MNSRLMFSDVAFCNRTEPVWLFCCLVWGTGTSRISYHVGVLGMVSPLNLGWSWTSTVLEATQQHSCFCLAPSAFGITYTIFTGVCLKVSQHVAHRAVKELHRITGVYPIVCISRRLYLTKPGVTRVNYYRL